MNETPATVRMIDGATAPAISNVFVNNACAVCTLQITGSFAAATVLVEGIVNVASNQWVTLAAFNLSDLSLEKDGADKAGIYQVGIEGILRVRMNVTEISGGDITIAAQFGNATINQFSKTEASNLVPITAYDLAVAGGYTGTLEQFETDMGNSASNATAAAESASSAAQVLTDVQTAGAEAVDAVQTKGQEVLASIPEDYTELTGEVGELKESLYGDESTIEGWVSGGISMTNGGTSSTNVRIHTPKIEIGKYSYIKADNDYGFNVFCYNGNTYLGCWTGTAFVKSGSAVTYQFGGKISIDDIRNFSSNVTHIIVTGGRYKDSTTAVSVSESIHFYFGIEGIVEKIDERIDEKFESVYKKGTIDNWTVGGVSVSTGATASSTVRIRTSKLPIENYSAIEIDETYGANIFCYSDSSYVGCWTGTGFATGGSALTYQFENRVNLEEIKKTNTDVSQIIVVGGKYQDASTTMQVTDAVHFTFIGGQIAESNEEIRSYVDESLALAMHPSANPNVVGIAHRGFNTVAPENTIPAYVLAKKKGFTYVECDVRFTSDGVPVLLHDETINRTARNNDGTAISGTINIANLTYAEALEYDFGIFKGEQYKGTRIPTFDEFVKCCKYLNLIPRIDVVAYPEGVVQTLYDISAKYNMQGVLEWAFHNYERSRAVVDLDPVSKLSYGVTSYDAALFDNIATLKTDKNKINISCEYTRVTQEIVNGCIDKGFTLGVWTINNASLMLSQNPFVKFIASDSINAEDVFSNYYLQ